MIDLANFNLNSKLYNCGIHWFRINNLTKQLNLLTLISYFLQRIAVILVIEILINLLTDHDEEGNASAQQQFEFVGASVWHMQKWLDDQKVAK